MKTHHTHKVCRFVRISQLLGQFHDTAPSSDDQMLEVFLRKSRHCRSCQPLQIAGGTAAWCSGPRATDLLEVLVLFVPELLRSGLDVVVLDSLEAVPSQDLSRLISCVKQLMDSGLWVVVEGTDGRPMELSSFREVVCNDVFLDIILRDMIRQEPLTPAPVLAYPVKSFSGNRRPRDRSKLAMAA